MATQRKKKPLEPIDDIASKIAEEAKDHNTGAATEKKEEEFYDENQRKELSKEVVKKAALQNQLTEKQIKAEDIRILDLEQNRIERKSYARRIFLFTIVWGLLIFLVIFSVATKKFLVFSQSEFNLSDKVVITLITSTTINFFGFFLLVVKYLFNTGSNTNKGKRNRQKKKEMSNVGKK